MEPIKKTARIVGILFIVGTVAGILSVLFSDSVLNDPDFVLKIYHNRINIQAGAFSILVMAVSLAMVPVMMYPLFRKYNHALALGTVLFRGALEGCLYILMSISWLLLIVLSGEISGSATIESVSIQLIAKIIFSANDQINPILGIIFSIGALMFYYLFYISKLIPRWLSLWGILGAILYLTAKISLFFGSDIEYLLAPLAVQEMVLAIRLLIYGFDSVPELILNRN